MHILDNNSLDCVYIDTNHDYETVINELVLSRDKVKHNGWITGHDYNIRDVKVAVDTFCSMEGLEISILSEDGHPSYYIQNIK